MLDLLLSPSKHSAGDKAESAKRVVEKALSKAGVDVGGLRAELEKHMAKQPKVTASDGADKPQTFMGRNLQRVLERARETKSTLGVSS